MSPVLRGLHDVALCVHCKVYRSAVLVIIMWLLHNLVEASIDLFRNLLLGDRLVVVLKTIDIDDEWNYDPKMSALSASVTA